MTFFNYTFRNPAPNFLSLPDYKLKLNFIFFTNITRLLFSKMFSTTNAVQMRRCYKYSQWFKSTLVLVPLFGAHYALMLVFQSFSGLSPEVEIVWLFVDVLFTSFQVSILDPFRSIIVSLSCSLSHSFIGFLCGAAVLLPE